MNRAILEACFPALLALVASFLALRLVMRLSGARLDLRRLRRLHRSQEGAVQSLSLVLTLPLFIMIVMFIVQVSQLMVGVVVVHQAAYTAARSMSVWVPAHSQLNGYYHESEDILPPPISPGSKFTLQYLGGVQNDDVFEEDGEIRFTYKSYKYQKLVAAAIMGCAPIAPSHDYGYRLEGAAGRFKDAAQKFYLVLQPNAKQPEKLSQRLNNKLSYSYWNTRITIAFEDKDSFEGPTYNPRVPVRLENGELMRDDSGVVVRSFNPQEVGWQDPLTLTINHDFALLPGPGRFLARYIVPGDPTAQRIHRKETPFGETVHMVTISASATMTNEGFKPVMNYIQSEF